MLRDSEWFMEVLRAAAEADAPDWWIGAGVIRGAIPPAAQSQQHQGSGKTFRRGSTQHEARGVMSRRSCRSAIEPSFRHPEVEGACGQAREQRIRPGESSRTTARHAPIESLYELLDPVRNRAPEEVS